MKFSTSIFSNEHLSAKAKGIYGYLATRPTLKGMTLLKLYQHMSNGYNSLRSGLKELRDYGYLSRQKKADGRIIWHLKKGSVHSSKLSSGQRKAYSIFGSVFDDNLTNHESKKLIQVVKNYSFKTIFYAFEIAIIRSKISSKVPSFKGVNNKFSYAMGILNNSSDVKGDFVFCKRKASKYLSEDGMAEIDNDMEYMTQESSQLSGQSAPDLPF